MRIYELMSDIADADAGQVVKVVICLSRDELESGEPIDQNTWALTLHVSDFDAETCTINTELP